MQSRIPFPHTIDATNATGESESPPSLPFTPQHQQAYAPQFLYSAFSFLLKYLHRKRFYSAMKMVPQFLIENRILYQQGQFQSGIRTGIRLAQGAQVWMSGCNPANNIILVLFSCYFCFSRYYVPTSGVASFFLHIYFIKSVDKKYYHEIPPLPSPPTHRRRTTVSLEIYFFIHPLQCFFFN